MYSSQAYFNWHENAFSFYFAMTSTADQYKDSAVLVGNFPYISSNETLSQFVIK